MMIEGWQAPDDVEKQIWDILLARFPQLVSKSEINNQRSEI